MPTEQTVLRTNTEIVFTTEELAALRKEYAQHASPEQFELWIAQCKRRGLVPQQDVVLQIRGVKEWDQDAGAKVFKKKAIYITTVAALRKLAERTGKYAGQLPSKWVYLDSNGDPTLESEVPLPESGSTARPRTPWAAKVSVLRDGFKQPITVPARFEAYAQYFTSNNQQQLNSTWANRGPEQLEKCAEALALRKAFPEELSGLYLAEEIKDEADVQATALEPVQKTDEAPAPASKRRKKSEAVVTELVNNPAVVEKLREEGLQIDHEELKKATSKSTEFSFGANAPVPAEGPETAQVPLAPSSPPRFEADDSDVPDNIGTPKYDRDTVKTLEREIEATGDNRFVGHKIDEFPSKEERNEIAKRLRAFGIDMQQLGDFVKKTSGKTDTREISKSVWASILDRLDKAVDDNDRKQIVLGK